jgi:hypothetical protein
MRTFVVLVFLSWLNFVKTEEVDNFEEDFDPVKHFRKVFPFLDTSQVPG